ncbi:Thiamine-binding periplasmic protein [Nocardioides aquaticus]|uniref:Thiamine-binding periplasmic protein n=1 Tax=Nocardioides aquaticus TaxID=160826 RepID=A0ABX8EE45_9ACTN|nr:thiamine ABC transporter substrate-binding protein [Nocardioides aquaticus]QVT78185.1 Thiamine-binding periplasmic protein [Nocardioides aquaticus]
MMLPARTRGAARPLLAGVGAAALLLTTSCSLVGGGDEDEASGTPTGAAGEAGGTVTLVTHDSFVLPGKVLRGFTAETGYDLEQRPLGDAGSMTNQLVLAAGTPPGDVAFGVDNTFASRALEEDVFVPALPDDLPAGVEDDLLPGDDEGLLTPVDDGNVCVNVDDTWFAERDLEPPASLDDLVDPAYADLLALPAATTSSPGLAFLLATIDEYGDDWPAYWEALVDNGAEITSGWEQAYQSRFTQGGGDGDRPVVVSYDSSPAFTVDGGRSTTSALLDTCYQQVEYAGVLAGAENPEGGAALVEYLLSPEVQEALPESMYVFPVVEDTPLPADWARFAERPTDPYAVDPAEIAANRDTWLREWADVTSR